MIKLRDAIKGKKTISFVKKPELYAHKCVNCGKVFLMKPYCDGANVATLEGIFDRCAIGGDGRGLGNMFKATVCSFGCADQIMNGGWKKLKEYKPYAKNNAILARCELHISVDVTNEGDLIKSWEETELN